MLKTLLTDSLTVSKCKIFWCVRHKLLADKEFFLPNLNDTKKGVLRETPALKTSFEKENVNKNNKLQQQISFGLLVDLAAVPKNLLHNSGRR